MNRILTVMKIHAKDRFSWFYLPWIILLSSFLINAVISSFVSESMITGGLSSIFVYMFVGGVVVLVQTFPFALGLSVRRSDFFSGTMLYFLSISLYTVIVLLILSFIESQVFIGWGTDLYFFHLPYVSDGMLIEQFFVFFLFVLHCFLSGFIISSLYRRFGKNGTYTFFILILMVSSIVSFLITRNQWWDDIFNWFAVHTAFELAIWTIPLTCIYMILSYLMLRKATV